MPQLIQIRQRIKAITTIQKVTQAMRLISMSSHARLKAKESIARKFSAKTDELLACITDTKNTPAINNESSNKLIIVIGSQKGLCGTFNNTLLQYMLKKNDPDSNSFIVVGKKLYNLIQAKYPFLSPSIITAYESLTAHNYSSVANTIIASVSKQSALYSEILVISNHSRSFFIQEPRTTRLHFLHPSDCLYSQKSNYLWETSIDKTIDHLIFLHVTATLNYLLCTSLLSEYAARFVSMDGATRNANTLLETTQREYNKIRQAKITRELTELIGGFSLHA